jgi:hypothetical protein
MNESTLIVIQVLSVQRKKTEQWVTGKENQSCISKQALKVFFSVLTVTEVVPNLSKRMDQTGGYPERKY